MLAARSSPSWVAKAEEPAPEFLPDDVDSWRNHARVQRHARNFARCTNRGKLLERYFKRALALDRKTRVRCICHVGSWVAILPKSDALLVVGPSGKSPVTLLAQLLRVRGCGKLSPWLHGVLRLVCERLPVPSAENANQDGEDDTQWEELRRSMPPCMQQAKKKPVQPISATDDMVAKRRHLFIKESMLWRNCDADQQQHLIQNWEFEFAQVHNEECINPLRLRALIRQLTAALSPPHSIRAQKESSNPMDIYSMEQLRRTSKLQRTVRRLLTWALETWRHTMWLDDEQIEPMLDHLVNLIEDFEQRIGDIREGACAGKQWSCLKAVLGAHSPLSQCGLLPRLDKKTLSELGEDTAKKNASNAQSSSQWPSNLHNKFQDKLKRRPWKKKDLKKLTGLVSDLTGEEARLVPLRMSSWRNIGLALNRTAVSCKNKYRKLMDPRYHPLERAPTCHEYGLLPALITEALTDLGGQATVPELLEHCRQDEGIQQEFGGRLSSHITKMSGTIRKEPAWEAAVRRNMSRWSKATQAKRDGHRVYVAIQRTRRRLMRRHTDKN